MFTSDVRYTCSLDVGGDRCPHHMSQFNSSAYALSSGKSIDSVRCRSSAHLSCSGKSIGHRRTSDHTHSVIRSFAINDDAVDVGGDGDSGGGDRGLDLSLIKRNANCMHLPSDGASARRQCRRDRTASGWRKLRCDDVADGGFRFDDC